jgi:hypothetical protein
LSAASAVLALTQRDTETLVRCGAMYGAMLARIAVPRGTPSGPVANRSTESIRSSLRTPRRQSSEHRFGDPLTVGDQAAAVLAAHPFAPPKPDRNQRARPWSGGAHPQCPVICR